MRKLLYLMMLLCLAACKKDENEAVLQGRYKGTLTPPSAYVNIPVEIRFKGNTYESLAGRGGGTFRVLGAGKVEFTDVHIWTAEFDWNLILSGTYDYYIQGDSLILRKNGGNGSSYQYKLVKIPD